MKKRLLCVLVAAVLLLGVLAGCGSDSNPSAMSSDGGSIPSTPTSPVSNPPEEVPASANPSTASPAESSDLGTGTPAEGPDDGLGEEVYVVTRYKINTLLADFISYACECAANGKPYNSISKLISSGQSMPIGGDLSLLKVDSRMALDSNYEDNFFRDLLSHLNRLNSTIKSYSVWVETEEANFNDFHYYKNTEAVLYDYVNITINYVNANNESKDIQFYYEFQFVNETDNPEQWLILARSNNIDKTKLLVNEDGYINNVSWTEVYRTVVQTSDLNRNYFIFLDVDSDGLPEMLYSGNGVYRINQNNLPEQCEIDGAEFNGFYAFSFTDAVRQYEIYTEKMNNGAAEMIRAYQEIIPEGFTSKFPFSDAYSFALDDFGSEQVMMFFDGALYQYKDGEAVKIFDFSELDEGLDDAGLLGTNYERTVFYLYNFFYDAAKGVYTEEWAAIDANEFTLIKALTFNWSEGYSNDSFTWSAPSAESFISASLISATEGSRILDAEEIREYHMELTEDNWGFAATADNVKDAYKGYIGWCILLNNPAY